MDLESRLRPDLWKTISAHYERADYTEAVRDSVYFVCDFLREKSGIEDKDGTKLVEASFFGNNPAILINKNESTTEKDHQQGIGSFYKGLMQAIRNPMSHEKTVYTQEEAEAIIIFINYLLNQTDLNGSTSKLDDIIELLFDESFTETQEYADLLVKEVPAKKRYDLLLTLYNRRDELPREVLGNFIKTLFSSLTKAAKSSFTKVVSASLVKCQDDEMLRMYFHYFMDDTYANIAQIAKLRIENLILKSIQAGKVHEDPESEEAVCNREGALATWVADKIHMLYNRKEIIDVMLKCTSIGEENEAYIMHYFDGEFEDITQLTEGQISSIIKRLCVGDEYFYDMFYYPTRIQKFANYVELFDAPLTKCEEEMAKPKDEQLPF